MRSSEERDPYGTHILSQILYTIFLLFSTVNLYQIRDFDGKFLRNVEKIKENLQDPKLAQGV